MSNRRHIQNGRLIYTCNCGWIDKGHVGVVNKDPHIGAINLWKQVTTERYTTRDTINRKPCFRVHYKQMMSRAGLSTGVEAAYLVRKGLSLAQKKSIALRIFLDVSHEFEGLQNSYPFRWVTDSGFSQEDLISNVVGFYQAVNNLPSGFVSGACKEVSVQASLDLWDKYLAKGIGRLKNYSHAHPYYYRCGECSGQPLFPQVFRSITPAKPGNGQFIRYKMIDSPPGAKVGLTLPRDFRSNGTVARGAP